MKVLASGAAIALVLGASAGAALRTSIASAAVVRGPQMIAEVPAPWQPPPPGPDLHAG